MYSSLFRVVEHNTSIFLQGIAFMRYYLVENVENHFVGCPSELATPEGEAINTVEFPLWKATQAFATVPSDFIEMPDVQSAEALTDVFPYANYWVISAKAKRLMQTLCLPDEALFIPTRIFNKKGDYLADYFTLHFKSFDKYDYLLDLDKSSKMVLSSGTVGHLYSWAFHSHLLPDYDLFPVRMEFVVSERLRKLFRSHRVTNAGFIPIWSPEEGPISRLDFPISGFDIYEYFEDIE